MKETLFGKSGIIVVTLDPARRGEERGSRDLLTREASSVRDEKRPSELRDDLRKIVRTPKGGSDGRSTWRSGRWNGYTMAGSCYSQPIGFDSG